MKPNVDLTENRLFTTYEKQEFSELHTLLIKTLKLNIPWRESHEVSSDNDLYNAISMNEKSFDFPTGNKSQRQKKIQESLYYAKTCEECGKELPRCPWIRHECTAYSMTIKKRIPWIF